MAEGTQDGVSRTRSHSLGFVAHDVITDRLHNASKPTNVPFKRQACDGDGDGPAIFD
jgi:hypothetical protein